MCQSPGLRLCRRSLTRDESGLRMEEAAGKSSEQQTRGHSEMPTKNTEALQTAAKLIAMFVRDGIEDVYCANLSDKQMAF